LGAIPLEEEELAVPVEAPAAAVEAAAKPELMMEEAAAVASLTPEAMDVATAPAV
jgi:hypothetical protein